MIERYELPVTITANQNLILREIQPSWKDDILSTLRAAGIKEKDEWDAIESQSMACPALPLCGLAISEAERALPDINTRIRAVLDKLGFDKSETFVVRMTGEQTRGLMGWGAELAGWLKGCSARPAALELLACSLAECRGFGCLSRAGSPGLCARPLAAAGCPNGCARPYMAELGFVGDGPNSYQIWLGGCPHGTRMAATFAERVKVQKLEETLEPIFAAFKAQRQGGESLGDFVARVGFDALRASLATAA